MSQQFVIPQFIDVEDKILGPISVRQFLLMLVAGGGMALSYWLLVTIANILSLFIISAVGIIILLILFAFVRVNGRPFHLFLLNLLQSLKNPRLRLWNNLTTERLQYRREPPPPAPIPTKQPLTQTKLARLALLVDTGGAFRDDDDVVYWGQTLPSQVKPEPK